MLLDPVITKRVQKWLEGPYDSETKAEIRRLLSDDPKSLSDAFFQDLSFGTGGMRGIMGVGTNRMNIYTIRTATQGLANYLKKQSDSIAVFIGYDVRLRSREFAEETARVLAGNGIRALVTKEICPSPLVSFGCRHHHCSAAVMITASHNPPVYNGYKVYWSDGGQVVPPHDVGIMEEVKKIHSPEKIALAPLDSSLIEWIGREIDQTYYAILKKLQLHTKLPKIQLVYSNLHGTGLRLIPNALKQWGYRSITYVEQQKTLDGMFPFAPSPNPEEPAALELGVQQLVAEEADLFIATDPDADRVGAVVREGKQAIALTGNQIGCLCLNHICSTLMQKKSFPLNAAFVKTIVTTELFRKIAESYGGVCIDVLTGFKYISEKISEWEASSGGYQFLFGAEESYGFLFGSSLARDKDAISTTCLIAEAAALAKQQNITLVDRLHQLYKKYGIHRESLTNLAFGEGKVAMDQMKALMQRLRKTPLTSIGGQKVLACEDYLQGHLGLPKSDVLRFWLSDKSKIVIRPSGTEPKIKIYAEVVQTQFRDLKQAIHDCDQRLNALVLFADNFRGCGIYEEES